LDVSVVGIAWAFENKVIKEYRTIRQECFIVLI
jgi:hypothetical protein